MKQILFLIVCLASVVATAQAQDYYAEEYIKGSRPRLSAKHYVSRSNGVYKSRSEGYDSGMGIPVRADERPIITIGRVERDSVKIYSYNQKVKTYTTMAFAIPKGNLPDDVFVDGNNVSDLAERLGVKPDPMTKEFLGMENINGYDCRHYRHTSKDGYRETWVYEPYKIIMQRIEGGTTFYLANIRMGAQPESLFELPADYKPNVVDLTEMNALLDMMQGKGKAGEMLKQGAKDLQEQDRKADAIQNDPNLSDQEKLIEALKMLDGAGKK